MALESTIAHLNNSNIKVVLTGVQDQPRRAFTRAGLVDVEDRLEIADDVSNTIEQAIATFRRGEPKGGG